MKKRIKKLWTEALRWGGYEQGAGVLRRDDSFCCLGVLCDLAVKEGIVTEHVEGNYSLSRYSYGDDDDRRDVVLPNAVVDWAFTKHELRAQGSYARKSDPKIGKYAASNWNDHQGKTFPEIADLIEEHL